MNIGGMNTRRANRRILSALAIPAAWVIGVFFAAPVVYGEEPSQFIRLDDINIVATPVIEGNEIDSYAAQKTTVSESQMDDLNAQDLAAALKRTPGVNISRYNPVGSFGGATGGGVFIRGRGSSRPGAEIKTLIDGIPAYMSVWNHPLLDLMSIDPAQSIEIYKSPQPHIFGNAFGVVNIVPKRMMGEGFAAKGEVAGGSHSTLVAKGEHGGRLEGFDYYLGGGYRTSDGHRENADGELRDLYGRAGYRFSENWGLSLFTFWNDNYANDPGAEGADLDLRQGRYETRTWLTVVTLENRYDAAEGHLKLYRNGGEGDWLDQPTDTPGLREDLFNDFVFYGLKFREALHFWTGGEIIVGFDRDVTDGDYNAEFSDGTRDDWDGHDFTIASPYTAVSHQFGHKEGFHVTPSAGVRYYDNSDFNAEWSPHAGLILGYKQTELHTGYSRGVIYPGLDVVVLSEKVNPALGSSWKNLKAETADHFEVGLSQYFGSLAIVDLTCFYDDGNDRYVIVPPPPPPPVFANIEEYRIRGVESTLSLYPTESLSLFFGFTYLDTDPSDLPYAPEIAFSAGMSLRFLKNFKLNLDCRYVDEMHVDAQARRKDAENTMTVDSYFLVNGKLSYDFVMGVRGLNVEVFLAGENLTNTSYEYLPGYPMPGATGMVGLGFKF